MLRWRDLIQAPAAFPAGSWWPPGAISNPISEGRKKTLVKFSHFPISLGTTPETVSQERD